jgi:ectoine hydroxylase
MDIYMNKYLELVKKQGFCRIKNVFSDFEVSEINNNINSYLTKPYDGMVREKNSSLVRAIHGMHIFESFFMDLARNNVLVNFSKQHLRDDIYIHQYKINMKPALEGDCWPWHQDYVYWKEGDYIETPRLLNAAIALDNISMLSGPLCVIPGSHLLGDLTKYDGVKKGDWSKDVSADLTYKIDKKVLVPLVSQNGYEFLTCNAGDVIFFDPQLAHASSNNISPHDRRLLLITYNAVSNAPVIKSKRPVFLSAVDFSPISALAGVVHDDELVENGVLND